MESHVGVKYKREYCDYNAIEKGTLQTHMKTIHDGVKYSYEYCDYCD